MIDPSLYSDTGRRFSEAESFRLDERGQPRIGFPWRTAFVAFFLFAFGLTFLLLGVLHFRDKNQGLLISFAVIGSIAFLPGTYASYNLYHAYRGTPGFHLSQSKFPRACHPYSQELVSSSFSTRTWFPCQISNHG